MAFFKLSVYVCGCVCVCVLRVFVVCVLRVFEHYHNLFHTDTNTPDIYTDPVLAFSSLPEILTYKKTSHHLK